MAPPRYSLSLSRVASRLLDNPRDLSWLMPGWFLCGGNEQRFPNVHKLYRTKPRNGRRLAKSKARSRKRRGRYFGRWRISESKWKSPAEQGFLSCSRINICIESVDTISSSRLSVSSRNISTFCRHNHEKLRVKRFWKLINFIIILFYKILRILYWELIVKKEKRIYVCILINFKEFHEIFYMYLYSINNTIMC